MKDRKYWVLLLVLISCLTACETNYKPEIKEYVEFLKKENVSATDYILKQWDQYDIVIVCERDHAEMTQYDLIQSVFSSEYFIKNVGYIFIEVGSVSVQERVVEFLNTSYNNNELREKALIDIYRDLSWPIWDKSNSYFMLLRINEINEKLKSEEKIQLFTSDEPMPLNGEIRNKEDLVEFESVYQTRDRDSVMAENIIAKFDSIKLHSSRKKCLIIMNYRHAFLMNVNRDKVLSDGTQLYGQTKGAVLCTGAILANYYPNNVASVYINSMTLGSSGGQAPIQNGKWDASFKTIEKENVGFNFGKSPFGVDSLDIWGFSRPEYTYADVFSGMVYYLPFEKHIRAHGLNNLIDHRSIDEVYRRLKIYTELYGGEIEKKDMTDIFKYKESTYWNLEECQEIISQWINN